MEKHVETLAVYYEKELKEVRAREADLTPAEQTVRLSEYRLAQSEKIHQESKEAVDALRKKVYAEKDQVVKLKEAARQARAEADASMAELKQQRTALEAERRELGELSKRNAAAAEAAKREREDAAAAQARLLQTQERFSAMQQTLQRKQDELSAAEMRVAHQRAAHAHQVEEFDLQRQVFNKTATDAVRLSHEQLSALSYQVQRLRKEATQLSAECERGKTELRVIAEHHLQLSQMCSKEEAGLLQVASQKRALGLDFNSPAELRADAAPAPALAGPSTVDSGHTATGLLVLPPILPPLERKLHAKTAGLMPPEGEEEAWRHAWQHWPNKLVFAVKELYQRKAKSLEAELRQRRQARQTGDAWYTRADYLRELEATKAAVLIDEQGAGLGDWETRMFKGWIVCNPMDANAKFASAKAEDDADVHTVSVEEMIFHADEVVVAGPLGLRAASPSLPLAGPNGFCSTEPRPRASWSPGALDFDAAYSAAACLSTQPPFKSRKFLMHPKRYPSGDFPRYRSRSPAS